ncbi:hypothetical protein DFA_00471 [Cavenderia fasciculata]|uniref:Uncharacterized protein n=1 Tax=Cavenderia fasciculata TaxID=261658 RepID=F4PS12_CACFS|nr:uncharacterized protein DFA_00471 [Cavenderia fasciculata]EGG20610.1 hypothetical protein DFA_00471 [Cavenderia fasciculata]|eukprot:XP_004358460.1 hypothetical protein DFA_00471 [Cavenderia fasciculata]
MEQPDDEFIEIVVILDREDRQNQMKIDSNDNDDDDKIKEKSVELLHIFLHKLWLKGKVKILSQSIMDAVKTETENNLGCSSLTDTFRSHLFNIREFIAIYEDDDEEDYCGGSRRLFISKLLSILQTKYDVHEPGNLIELIIKCLPEIEMSSESITWNKLAKRIIDTLTKVLNRHRENRQAPNTNTRSILEYLIVLAEKVPVLCHIQSTISYLYYWLADVKDMELKEWTDQDNLDMDSNYIKFYYDEERNDKIIPHSWRIYNKYYDDDDKVSGILSYAMFEKFSKKFNILSVDFIYKHFNLLVNSQMWKERYAAMIGLTKSFKYSRDNLISQFPLILKLVLKLTVEDENIRVRWASLQCLIQLVIEFKVLVGIQYRDEIFQVIFTKLINDPNERIQGRC